MSDILVQSLKVEILVPIAKSIAHAHNIHNQRIVSYVLVYEHHVFQTSCLALYQST